MKAEALNPQQIEVLTNAANMLKAFQPLPTQKTEIATGSKAQQTLVTSVKGGVSLTISPQDFDLNNYYDFWKLCSDYQDTLTSLGSTINLLEVLYYADKEANKAKIDDLTKALNNASLMFKNLSFDAGQMVVKQSPADKPINLTITSIHYPSEDLHQQKIDEANLLLPLTTPQLPSFKVTFKPAQEV